MWGDRGFGRPGGRRAPRGLTTAVIGLVQRKGGESMATKRRRLPRAPEKETATMDTTHHAPATAPTPEDPVTFGDGPLRTPPYPLEPAASLASRAVVEQLYGGGDFYLEIDSVEEFAAFVSLVMERRLDPRSVADFAAAKLERRKSRPAAAGGFMLVFTSLHDFAAFLGILRGQILDVSSLADVSNFLATARARLAASVDREGGARRAPAAGPAPAHPLSPRQPSEPTGDVPVMADQDPQAIIDNMVNEAAADVTVMGSAGTVIDGIDGLLATAVQQALAGGATAAQIAPFVSLQTTLQTSREALTASIAARTPADSEVPASHAHLKTAHKGKK